LGVKCIPQRDYWKLMLSERERRVLWPTYRRGGRLGSSFRAASPADSGTHADVPGFDVAVWHGIAAPAGMDPALVARINGVFNDVLRVSAVRTAITETQAGDVVGGTPQQFDAFIKSELQRWPAVVKAAGIKPE
jgi:tripartite-type tricarboxylate transporter receptor subunit TctC